MIDRDTDWPRWFSRPAHEVAPELLGMTLHVDGVGGVIVEVEAYGRDDPASHSFRGQTARNAAMFGPPASAYVYRSYGLHWCFNIVCELGSAVLVRALEPRDGIEEMNVRRRNVARHLLCAGPGRLGEALGIDARLNGSSLLEAPFLLRPGARPNDIVSTSRVGISKAQDRPWRFYSAGSDFVSRPRLPAKSRAG